MEKVQLIGQDGRAYISADGRCLYTMGDYTPSVGDTVYANGRYIYGHQAGAAHAMIVNDSMGGIPYLTDDNEIWFIDDDGIDRPLLKPYFQLEFLLNDDRFISVGTAWTYGVMDVYDMLAGTLQCHANTRAICDIDLDDDGNVVYAGNAEGDNPMYAYHCSHKLVIPHRVLDTVDTHTYSHSETNSPIPAYCHTSTSDTHTPETSHDKTVFSDSYGLWDRALSVMRNGKQSYVMDSAVISDVTAILADYAHMAEYDVPGKPYPSACCRPQLNSDDYSLSVRYEYVRVDRAGQCEAHISLDGSKSVLGWCPGHALVSKAYYSKDITNEKKVHILFHTILEGTHSYDEVNSYTYEAVKTLCEGTCTMNRYYKVSCQGALSLLQSAQSFTLHTGYKATFLTEEKLSGPVHIYKDGCLQLDAPGSQGRTLLSHHEKGHWEWDGKNVWDSTYVTERDERQYGQWYSTFAMHDTVIEDTKTACADSTVEMQDGYYFIYNRDTPGSCRLYSPNETIASLPYVFDSGDRTSLAICSVKHGGYVFIHQSNTMALLDDDGAVRATNHTVNWQPRLRRYPDMQQLKRKMIAWETQLYQERYGSDIRETGHSWSIQEGG